MGKAEEEGRTFMANENEENYQRDMIRNSSPSSD